ncbi:hypothetical protein D4A47_06280 [Anaerotruncus massiliensis (ex Liu et al. 2021)]|uniref:Uncharacterized protein n=2 Tax=Anaerotruncus TaxID=244127 RepID=A0A498D1L9_9FIRM|nr:MULTISPECIES: hypothetical protein [Anaerotruncus]MBC3938520.1 hypothetical protein [Anaerotruncus massiliensis (ex Togo et al. 2019)]RLL12130.1 hypothetical protein D4A47_06280 [Anaerotruncus massiliensis (ex Liu et al. 2021)]
MNNVKSKSVEIELGAQLFKIEFDFNVLCEIQERYGSLDTLDERLQDVREIRWLLTVLLNEAIDKENDEGAEKKHVDESWVGRTVNFKNIGELAAKIAEAFGASMPDAGVEAGDEGEDDPNSKTE